jgi:hypothetical protein
MKTRVRLLLVGSNVSYRRRTLDRIHLDSVECGGRHQLAEAVDAGIPREIHFHGLGEVLRHGQPPPNNLFRTGSGANPAPRRENAVRLPVVGRFIGDVMDDVYREDHVERGIGKPESFSVTAHPLRSNSALARVREHLVRRIEPPTTRAAFALYGRKIVAAAAANLEHAGGCIKAGS